MYVPKHPCCLNCAHRVYVDGEVVPRSDDEVRALSKPLPNADDAGELGQHLLIPDHDDNPAFLMRTTDDEIRKFHGRFNQCAITKENLDLNATYIIDRLLGSADYTMSGGIIYAIMLDVMGVNYRLSDVKTPHEVVKRDYELNLISGDTSTLYRKYKSISDIVRENLMELGTECPDYQSRMTGGKIKTTQEFSGRQLKVVI